MKPKEKTFDFSNKSATKMVGTWIMAISKIPFMRHRAYTYTDVIEHIAKTHKLKIADLQSNNAITCRNGFIIGAGFFTDPNDADRERDCFQITLFPFEKDEDLRLYFERGNIARFESGYKPSEYENLIKEVGIPLNKKITWQKAYNVLCKVAEYEQRGVPECVLA